MRKLRTEKEIIGAWKGSSPTTPLVSICCITYNHEPFIEDALEGFLTQETNFSFEILIHDDASTDRTADIIREYEAAYSNLIKPIYQTENQHSKGTNPVPLNLDRAKGKYIAMCEGDDYWVDKEKLQKQFDLMAKNREYVLCFHTAYISYENHERSIKIMNRVKTKTYNFEEVIENWLAPTSSLFFKNNVINQKILSNPNLHHADSFLLAQLANAGKIYGMEDVMSVYRKHRGGISYHFDKEKHMKMIRQYAYMNKFDEKKNLKVYKKKICGHAYSIIYDSYANNKEVRTAIKSMIKINYKLLFTKKVLSLIYVFYIKVPVLYLFKGQVYEPR